MLQGGQVGPAFFDALARVRAIHDNCRQLLRSHHQRAGLELMDQMSHYQEGAYEHLCRWDGLPLFKLLFPRCHCNAHTLSPLLPPSPLLALLKPWPTPSPPHSHPPRWVQAECRNLGEHDAPEVDPTLTAAVAALRQRPVLFKYCAEEVAGARHGALFQRFIVALTRGGPGGVPAPIEIHAHDPRRYVADMMAWAHQALAGEREFVMALFGEGGGDEGDERQQPQQQQQQAAAVDGGGGGGGGGAPDGLSSAALLDRIFEGVCRPLRVRVEQVLMMSPPLLLCYQLTQLGAFYQELVARILGPKAALSAALAGCRDMARRAFFEQLRAAGDRLLRAPPAPAPDLLPPPAVAAALQLLAEIIAAHEGALGGGGGGGDEADGDGGFAAVLDAVVDPLLETCRRSSDALRPDSASRLDEAPAHAADPSAQPVFMLNCVAAVQAVMAPHACCAPRAGALAATAEELVRQLVRGEASRLLGRSGLSEIVERMRLYQVRAGGVCVGGGWGCLQRQSEAQFVAAEPPLPTLPAPPPGLWRQLGPPGLGPRSLAARRQRGPPLPLRPHLQPRRPARVQAGAAAAAAERRRRQVRTGFRKLGAWPPSLPPTNTHPPHPHPARLAAALADAYELVYTTLGDPGSGYPEAGGTAGIKHTPLQVRTILGVTG